MANTDLLKYNLSELKNLNFEIEKEIKSRQQQEVREAREQILAIAEKAGVSIKDLLSTSPGKKSDGRTAIVVARYRNRDDSSQVWSGRGRRPRWVVEALLQGKTLTELKI